MKLQKIIEQLSLSDYKKIARQFKKSNAEKYLSLLAIYRKNQLNDKEIAEELNLSNAAFYTLRSRLYDKLQEFLYQNIPAHKAKLTKNVANLNFLLFKKPKETAEGLLLKLEEELIKYDMPHELTVVYQALKKINIHTQKYFEYEKLFNKQIAFNLAQYKAEDILSSFCKVLSEYYISKSQEKKELLMLYKKELDNINKLYDSHRLQFFNYLAKIHYFLFVDSNYNITDEPIELMLEKGRDIVSKHKDDSVYIHFHTIMDFLSFEYNVRNNRFVIANQYYKNVCEDISNFLNSKHSCFVYKFLISKLVADFKFQKFETIEVNIPFLEIEHDIPSKIIFSIYKSAECYYNDDYDNGVKILEELCNEISFKHYPFGEMEVKLMLILLMFLNGQKEKAEMLVGSVFRKLKDEENASYFKNASNFNKIIRLIYLNKDKDIKSKLIELYDFFDALNYDTYKILDFLVITDKHWDLLLTVKKAEQNMNII